MCGPLPYDGPLGSEVGPNLCISLLGSRLRRQDARSRGCGKAVIRTVGLSTIINDHRTVQTTRPKAFLDVEIIERRIGPGLMILVPITWRFSVPPVT